MSQYDSIEQKASYGIGRNMGDQLAQQAFAGLDIPALQQGLADALNGLEFAVSRDDINDAFQVITARMQEEQEAVAKAAAADGEAFLADNAKRADVKVTDSGLQYEVMVEGNGAVPVAGQSVRVHYHGTFTHGGVFDSSVARGQPAEFPVTGVRPRNGRPGAHRYHRRTFRGRFAPAARFRPDADTIRAPRPDRRPGGSRPPDQGAPAHGQPAPVETPTAAGH